MTKKKGKNRFLHSIVQFAEKNRIGIYMSIITVLLGYGFLLTNASIGTDDTAGDVYFQYGWSLRMSRLFMPLVHKLFDIVQFTPFWTELLALIFLLLSGWFMIWVMEQYMRKEIPQIVSTGFVCVFLSYSLINEIFIYSYMSVSIGIGYLFTVAAIYFWNKAIKRKGKKDVLFSIFFLLISISLYESFVAVFFCLAGIELLLEYWDVRISFSTIGKRAIGVCGVAAVAIVIERLIAKICIAFYGLSDLSVSSNTSIVWLEQGPIEGMKSVFRTLFYDQFVAGVEYQPILFWGLSVAVLGLAIVWKAIRKKNITFVLVLLWIITSAEAIVILQGQTFYRSCQTFGIVVAFVIALVGSWCCERKKSMVAMLLFLMAVLIQTQDLSNWFYLNHRRHEIEVSLTESLVVDMKKEGLSGERIAFVYDEEMPEEYDYYMSYNSISSDFYLRRLVNVIVEKLPFSDAERMKYEINRRHNQTNCLTPYLAYGVNAFQDSHMGPNYELKKLLQMHFFQFEQVSWDELEEARLKSHDLKSYPSDGYYTDMGDYYIVKIGV